MKYIIKNEYSSINHKLHAMATQQPQPIYIFRFIPLTFYETAHSEWLSFWEIGSKEDNNNKTKNDEKMQKKTMERKKPKIKIKIFQVNITYASGSLKKVKINWNISVRARSLYI